jgi:hypothetical protein
MKNNSLLDPLIMQSAYVEQGLAGRNPLINRSGSEIWYFVMNFGLPLLCIIIVLLILRMRYNYQRDQSNI